MRIWWLCVAFVLLLAACTRIRVDEPRARGTGTLTLVHHEYMSETFRLVTLSYKVDGRRVFETTSLAANQPTVVLSQIMPAGAHKITVSTVYQGHGIGDFEYLEKYKFTIKSKHTVTILDRQHLRVDITAYEHGDVFTPIDKRPRVDVRETTVPSPTSHETPGSDKEEGGL